MCQVLGCFECGWNHCCRLLFRQRSTLCIIPLRVRFACARCPALYSTRRMNAPWACAPYLTCTSDVPFVVLDPPPCGTIILSSCRPLSITEALLPAGRKSGCVCAFFFDGAKATLTLTLEFNSSSRLKSAQPNQPYALTFPLPYPSLAFSLSPPPCPSD